MAALQQQHLLVADLQCFAQLVPLQPSQLAQDNTALEALQQTHKPRNHSVLSDSSAIAACKLHALLANIRISKASQAVDRAMPATLGSTNKAHQAAATVHVLLYEHSSDNCAMNELLRGLGVCRVNGVLRARQLASIVAVLLCTVLKALPALKLCLLASIQLH